MKIVTEIRLHLFADNRVYFSSKEGYRCNGSVVLLNINYFLYGQLAWTFGVCSSDSDRLF